MADDLVDVALQQKDEVELDSIEELSSEDLEKVIETEDPEFAQKIKQLEADKLTLGAEDLELQSLQGLQKFLAVIKRQPKKFVSKVKDNTVRTQRLWSSLKGIKKLIFVGSSLGTILVFVYLAFILQNRLIKEDELFVTQFAKHADQVFPLNFEKGEDLYRNNRLQENLYLFPKIIVNLKPNPSSGQSMGAFEFFLEGISQDSIIEMKEKEIELKDLIQRVVEGFTFEELESQQGKQALLNQIQKEVSENLDSGLVKRVLIKNIILKPPVK